MVINISVKLNVFMYHILSHSIQFGLHYNYLLYKNILSHMYKSLDAVNKPMFTVRYNQAAECGINNTLLVFRE